LRIGSFEFQVICYCKKYWSFRYPLCTPSYHGAPGRGSGSGGASPGSLVSCEGNRTTVEVDRSVTFRHRADEARSVCVRGSFNDWKSIELENHGHGFWETRIDPLSAGTYVYQFEVDGKLVHDCSNPKRNVKRQSIESILEIGGGDNPTPAPCPPQEFRTLPSMVSSITAVSLNTHSVQEQNQRFKKLVWMAQGLAEVDADVVGLTEVVFGRIYARGYQGRYYDTADIIKEHLESFSGWRYHLYRVGFARWDEGENLGLAILSKFPLVCVRSMNLTTRSFWPAPHSSRMCLQALVDLPGQGPLHLFVTHPMGYQSPDTAVQVREIKAFVSEAMGGESLGSIVMGDFNIPDTDEFHYRLLTESVPSFRDLAREGMSGSPPSTHESGSRIDYIFWVDPEDRKSQFPVEASIIFDGQGHGPGRRLEKEPDKVLSRRVSDHFGVVARMTQSRPR